MQVPGVDADAPDDASTGASTEAPVAAPADAPDAPDDGRGPATTDAPAPPRVVLWTSLAVVVAGIVMGVVGALQSGISWDEPFHVMRLRNYLDIGWFAIDWSHEAGGPDTKDSNTAVYGPVTMLLLHGLAVLVGVEQWGTVSTTPTAYDVRHLGVLAIGLAGTAAAAGITQVLLRSWRWGLVTAAALLALPMWTGHLMFNIKDVPVATGYTVTTLALVAICGADRGRPVVRALALAAGIVLMVGTRPGMAPAVVAALVVLVAGTLLHRGGRTRQPLVEAAAGVGLAATVLVAVYPRQFSRPGNLLQSADQSTSFRDGQDASYLHVPSTYLTQVPLLLQGLFLVGFAVAVALVLFRWRADTVRATRLTLVGAQLLALPLVAMVTKADLYNGLRQLLFASPVWAVVVTLGAAKLVAWTHAREHDPHGPLGGRVGRRVVAGTVVVALVAPVVDQVTQFPYQYTYYNAALDLTGDHVQSDYWRTSLPELLPDVPTDGPIVCSPTRATVDGAPAGSPGARGVPQEEMIAGRYLSDSSVDCRIDPIGPLAPIWAARDLPLDDDLEHDEFYAIIDRNHGVPANCERLAAVTRTRHFREIPMTYVALCRSEPSELSGTVDFGRVDGQYMAPPLWSYAPLGWVLRDALDALDAPGDSAVLSFAVPPTCAPSGCSLVLDADAPDDLTATVDDQPVAVVVSAGSVTLTLPPGEPDPWVTLERASAEPLGLRVRSIRLVPAGKDG